VTSTRTVVESPWVGLVLAVSGGFLDAYTYVAQGGVFANAMTGNVVLAAVSLSQHAFGEALLKCWPILAYAAGVCASEALRLPRVWAAVRRPYLAILGLEMLVLSAGALNADRLPQPWVVVGIGFVAALQTTTFRRIGAFAYSSVMTTGNLRSFACASFHAVARRDAQQRRKALVYASVIACFFAGALLGAGSAHTFGNGALWLPVALVGTAVALLVLHLRAGGSAPRPPAWHPSPRG
jgi:uncharacterized membrane protein YoaK (UPF0700 family)